jgi:hypothetical protein
MNIKEYKYQSLSLSDPIRKERNINLTNLALDCQKQFDEKKFLLIWEELEGYINWYLRKVVNWIPGYTRDCIITECRTMLYTNAIKNYKPICINKKGEEVAVSFRYWAIMVMKGHIISTLDDTKLNKNKIVNYALHLDWQAGEDEEDKLEEL